MTLDPATPLGGASSAYSNRTAAETPAPAARLNAALTTLALSAGQKAQISLLLQRAGNGTVQSEDVSFALKAILTSAQRRQLESGASIVDEQA